VFPLVFFFSLSLSQKHAFVVVTRAGKESGREFEFEFEMEICRGLRRQRRKT